MMTPGFEWIASFSELAVTLAVNLLAQSTLLIVVGLLVARSVRAGGSALQSAIARMTLAAVLLGPLASFGLSAMGVRGLVFHFPRATTPAVVSPTPLTAPEPDVSASGRSQPAQLSGERNVETQSLRPSDTEQSETVASGGSASTADAATLTDGHAPSAGPRRLALLSIALTAMWLGGSGFLLVRLHIAHRYLGRVRRSAKEALAPFQSVCRSLGAQMQIRAPLVLVSARAKSPCLMGFFRSAILLPESSDLEDQNTVREVLAHELAHLARGDCLWNLLSRIAQAAVFFQPLVWVLGRRIENLSDDVADDYVVHHGNDRHAYARRLADIAERYQPALSEALAGMGVIAFKSSLGRRIGRVLDTTRRLSIHTGSRSAAAVVIVGLSATLAAGLIGASGQNLKADSARRGGTPATVTTRQIARHTWQLTDKYIPPDFAGFFPNDPQAAKDLHSLNRSEASAQLSDSETLSLFRRGFRAYEADRGEILRWMGNRYIAGKQPQNPEAIEIMYHISDIPDYGTRGASVFYLCAIQPKPPAILRRLADLAMSSDDPNLLNNIAQGCASQRDHLLACLQPHLKSDQEATRAKAEIVARIVRGEINAFRWWGEKYRAKRYAELSESTPEYAKLSLGELTDRRTKLAAELRTEATRYRASSPVFQQYAELVRKYVVPWALEAEKARLKCVELAETDPEALKKVKYMDRQAEEEAIGKIIGPVFKEIAAAVQKLELYPAYRQSLDQQSVIYLNGALFVVRKYGDAGELREQYTNPFEEGTWPHIFFDTNLKEPLLMTCGAFGKVIAKLPPALEEKQKRIETLHELIENHPSLGDAEPPPKYADEYVGSLEKEYDKIRLYTEQYWETRRQKEAARKKETSVSGR